MHNMRHALWVLGNLLSAGAGVLLAMKYGFEIGMAAGYALSVLVDIREQTTPNDEVHRLAAFRQSAWNDGLERGTLLENGMDKRIGRFAMSRQLVERDPDTARAVMGRCIVVRCEMMYAPSTLEYMALSPDFDEVPQGMIVPEYDVIISDGGKRIEFKRSNVEIRG